MPGKRRGRGSPSVPAAVAERPRARDPRDELLSALSHDLRSPLGSLLVWLELLRGQELDPGTARVAARIETGVKDLRDLVLRFLDMALILSGGLGLEVDDVDPRAVVEAAIGTHRARAEVKGVRVVAAFDPSLALLRADHRCLARGLESLIAHAVQATPEGGSVDVHVEGTEDRIRFRVRADGRGLPPEVLPLFRDLAAGVAPEGGGLDLAIALGVARLHGGAVHAASEGEGRGSLVVLDLPLRPSPPLSRGSR